jgi:hypothetical protein
VTPPGSDRTVYIVGLAKNIPHGRYVVDAPTAATTAGSGLLAPNLGRGLRQANRPGASPSVPRIAAIKDAQNVGQNIGQPELPPQGSLNDTE